MRKKFIEDNKLSCDTCSKKHGAKCKSKVYCIVKDPIFNLGYVEKDSSNHEKL